MCHVLIKQNISTDRLFVLLIVDMLLFPFVPILKIPFGCIIWVMLAIQKKNDVLEVKKEYLILLFFALVSIGNCYITLHSYFRNNIMNIIPLLMSLAYLHIFSKNTFDLKGIIIKVLEIYLVFNFFLVVLYLINYNAFFIFRSIFTFSGTAFSYSERGILTRYCGIMSDPNNCGCATVAILCYLLDNTSYSTKKNILFHLIVLITIVATMSVTAIIAFAFMFVIRILHARSFNPRIIISSLGVIVIITIAAVYLSKTETGSLFIQRIQLNTSDNSGGGRTKIWTEIIKNKNILKYVLWGDGGTIVINDNIIRPHNGFIYLIYNFGLVFCLTFTKSIARFFNKKTNWIWIFMINFVLNTIIQDYRALMIYIILVICEVYSADTTANKEISK